MCEVCGHYRILGLPTGISRCSISTDGQLLRDMSSMRDSRQACCSKLASKKANKHVLCRSIPLVQWTEYQAQLPKTRAQLGNRPMHDISTLRMYTVSHPRKPFIGPSAASFSLAMISAYFAGLPRRTVRSTTETSLVGTRNAMPVSLPFNAGRTWVQSRLNQLAFKQRSGTSELHFCL